jgi:hypothetical protein
MEAPVVAAIVRTALDADGLRAIVRAAEPFVRCEIREAWRHDDGLRRYYVKLDSAQFPGLRIWTEGWPRVWAALRDSDAGRDGLIDLSVAHETYVARPERPRPTA